MLRIVFQKKRALISLEENLKILATTFPATPECNYPIIVIDEGLNLLPEYEYKGIIVWKNSKTIVFIPTKK